MASLKVEFFVPANHLEAIIEALNKVELLTEENYDYCYSYTPVKGHFRPLKDANPFIGEVQRIEQVDELKVEFRIQAKAKEEALSIIKEYHPYEVPVINFIKLV